MAKKKTCFLLIIIMILGIHIKAWAFDLDTSVNTQMLKEKKIEISLTLSDLGDYPNGINVVSGKLRYDSDVFENISFTGMNNWTCAYNNEKGNDKEGKFILMTTAGNVKVDTEVAKIELTLKPDINNLQTKIKIEQIETSYQSEKIKTEEKEFKFIIVNDKIELAEDNKKKEDQEIKETQVEDASEEKDVLAEKKATQIRWIFLILSIILLVILVILIIIINIKRRGKNEN